MPSRFVLTDRVGGISSGAWAGRNLGDHVGDDPVAVRHNRTGLAVQLGVERDNLVWMRQVHGARVQVVTDGSPGDVPDVDALVTDRPGLALAVLVADCVPVLLADDEAAAHGVAAVAHAGRAGVELGVVPATLAAMRSRGALPSRVRALLGPAVCAGCYEVPAQLQEQVCAVVPQARARTRAGTPALDLRAAVLAQLLAAGVGRVEVDGRCTVEDPELFSYRRERTTGRFAAVAVLTAADPAQPRSAR